MSKINTFRFINLNYNNNAIKISDETMHTNGDSTLISLQNGGGKSVLVQMMMAPFVHKRYRDTPDRPFESYFTTASPTFIMAEWVLDQGAGYVLVGMMIRRSQDVSEDTNDNLEITNFIYEYKKPNAYDINHLPVIEKGLKDIRLKSYRECKSLFESYKKDPALKFNYYDMSNAAQSRQYFDKLSEYQIQYKEWEGIIKKVNIKESGLSDLFRDCKDEKGLVEKWFLDSVEKKLNKDQDRIKEFQNIVQKYIYQYKQNKNKIERRDTIKKFQEEASEIRVQGLKYQQACEQVNISKHYVLDFIVQLKDVQSAAIKEQTTRNRGIHDIKEEIAYLNYGKISKAMHGYEDDIRNLVSNKELIEMERDDLEQQSEKVKREIYAYQLAKQKEELGEFENDYLNAAQQLDVARKDIKDTEPERQSLGYTLKVLYQREQRGLKEKEALCEEDIKTQESLAQGEEEKLDAYQNEAFKLKESIGRQKEKIEAYNQWEETFNKEYNENLIRNILGRYEAGSLEIKEKTYENECRKTEADKHKTALTIEKRKEESYKTNRDIDDTKDNINTLKADIKDKELLVKDYENQIKDRRLILKYLDVSEQDLFDSNKLLIRSEGKKSETELSRRTLEREEMQIQKDLDRMTKGRILELPVEFEDMLRTIGVQYTYGMEWLSKNGNTEEENRKLINNYPFLPYALIMTKTELERLSVYQEEVYINCPVPIMVREAIKDAGINRETKSLQTLGEVSFYMLFNQDLLDEEKLAVMVEKKSAAIRKKQEAVQIKKDEYDACVERHNILKNQTVTKELYEKAGEELETKKEELTTIESLLKSRIEHEEELQIEMTELKERLQQLSQNQLYFEKRKKELETLKIRYDEYAVALNKVEKKGKRTEELENLSTQAHDRKKLASENIEDYKNLKMQINQQLQSAAESAAEFESFEKSAIVSGDKNQLEARYKALTSNISTNIKNLEEQVSRTFKYFDKARKDLEEQIRKFALSRESWEDLKYDLQILNKKEILQEDYAKKIDNKDFLISEENTNIAVAQNEVKNVRKQLQKECNKEEPLPKEEIKEVDFDSEINQLESTLKEEEKQFDDISKRVQLYEANLVALSPFEEQIEYETTGRIWNLSEMEAKEIRREQGILVRDYNNNKDKSAKEREVLERMLNRLARMEEFQEDYFKKPIETLIDITTNADSFLRQLDIFTEAFERQIEKLDIDISVVEKEKASIVELLEDYIKEVHVHLGKIDQNSTITVREKPVKMLRIELPSWEDNEAIYHLRINDYMDEMTNKAVAIYENNENAQEYLGTSITTRELYDKVVGIGEVRIKLFKIEAQREYPITWAEVARNSGGEGFLSAFVVLTSLLYYMRKDDTDIFAEKNEGKVLIMDNPFAQTNASHLLKPLMQMAKKTNTQLIALTGLGGESIYNRFDNIYVLNLITASLRTGMQYLKADHKRGNEPETIISSQIEVIGQQELLF